MTFDQINFRHIIQWVNAPIFQVGQTPVTLGGIGTAFFVLMGALVVSSVVQRAISLQLTGRFKISSGLTYALRRILHYVILVMGIILAAQCIGINLGSLAVVFGFLSVGIGFGLQNMTSNFISGLILLLEQPISVGDMISIENQVGTVTDIRMRSTVIQTFDNISIIVPNSKFIENQITNWSFGDPRVRIHCPVGVAYGSDIQKVKETLLEVARSEADALKNPEPEVRFLGFGDSSLNFDLLVWSDRPDRQYRLRSKINYEIDAAFRQADIRIPFPQQDLYLQMTPAIERLASLGSGGT